MSTKTPFLSWVWVPHILILTWTQLIRGGPATSSKSSSPICVRALNILGTVEKVCFVRLILTTEHLTVLVHEIFEGGFVLVIVTVTIIDTMSVRVSEWTLISQSCPTRKNTCSTLVSTVRWHTVYTILDTDKPQGNTEVLIKRPTILLNTWPWTELWSCPDLILPSSRRPPLSWPQEFGMETGPKFRSPRHAKVDSNQNITKSTAQKKVTL